MRMRLRYFSLILWLFLITDPASRVLGRPLQSDPESDALFSGPIRKFELQVDRSGIQSLRKDPRKPVQATLRVGTNSWDSVGIHIKGAAGSARDIDDLPALTIRVNRFRKGQRALGLTKFHLNNSVQDASRMSEIVCADLYLRAGIPATRATHALVFLNGRRLGLYVLKEGFDRNFLKRHFHDPTGNLYDGGFLQDIDQDLGLDSGREPPDWSDLRALSAACQIVDDTRRREALERLLDVDRFITYTALQIMTEDWDGYPANRNNYRLYHEPNIGRFTFLPHGMDQMFDQGGMAITRGFEGLVAQRVFQVREWQNAYFERIGTLLTNAFTAASILPSFDAAVERREAVLSQLKRREAEEIRSATRDLRERIIQRIEGIRQQLEQRPRPSEIGSNGLVPIPASQWTVRLTEGKGQAERRPTGGEGERFHLELRTAGQISWRTRITLPAGEYRFEGRGQVRDVQSSPDGTGLGLGLRISGSQRTSGLTGTTGWEDQSFGFRLDFDSEVELVAELRARRGSGMFDSTAFKLRKLR